MGSAGESVLLSSGFGLQGWAVALLAPGLVSGVVPAGLPFGFLNSVGICLGVGAWVPSTIVLIVEAVVVISIAAASVRGVGRRSTRRTA